MDSLADTDIPDLPFVDQFFKFLPGGVGVRGQLFIDYNPPIHVELFLECNRPVVLGLSGLEPATTRQESAPVNEVKIQVRGLKVGQRFVQTRFDIFRSMERIPQLSGAISRV